MSILFSRECEYALRGVLYLALQKPGAMTPTKDISERLGVPYHFLSKTFQKLVDHKILASQKGPLGGFALAKPAHEIRLLQLIHAIDGDGFATECVMGFPECSSKNPCPAHNDWGGIREKIVGMLSDRNILEMAREMRKPEYLKGHVKKKG